MTILIILASFGMFTVILLIGITIGYMIGYRNDRSLKQQISKLKTTIKKQNESKQLNELTKRELAERDNWDMRVKLAELTGFPATHTSLDTPVNDDPASMERMF